MTSDSLLTVTMLLRTVPHYRVAFLERLERRLCAVGIRLRVVYGQEYPGTEPRSVQLDYPWAFRVFNTYWRYGSMEFVWQPGLDRSAGSDLIIVEQANRLLINYLLLMRRTQTNKKLAFWGHGWNMQAANPNALRERLKRMLLDKVDWWFAYTEMTEKYLVGKGASPHRLTVVNNAVDDSELIAGLADCMHRSPMQIAYELGCATDAQVGLYCGQLSRHKHLEFLLRAAVRIRELLPRFELLVVGDGPQRAVVEAASHELPWIHCVGSVLGPERAKYWRAAQVALMPGAVGLVLVDSFVAACPLVTRQLSTHGPEIAYLHSGENGLMTEDDLESYAQGVATLLSDDARMESLRAGCRHSASDITLDNMVERFAGGVEQCLARTTIAAEV